MKKALIYLLLFSGITLIFILLALLAAGLFFDNMLSATGMSHSELTVVTVLLTSVLWMIATVWTFSHFRMVDLGKGSLSYGGLVRTSVFSTLVLLCLNVIGYGYYNLTPHYEADDQIMLLTFRNMPVTTLTLYIIMYMVTQLVFVGGILKELLASYSHRGVVILCWATVLSVSDFAGGLSLWSLFLTGVATYSVIGYVFARTNTILPGATALIITDFMLIIFAGYQPSFLMMVIAFALLPVSLLLLFGDRFRVMSEWRLWGRR